MSGRKGGSHNSIKNIWEEGYGIIKHSSETQKRVSEMLTQLIEESGKNKNINYYELLIAADKLTNAAIWLVAHQVYAKNVYLDGRELKLGDFKPDPQGHMGGALNMVPAYAGYMLINALTGKTRAWVMEQGHAVSAIDSVNLLLDNMTEAHGKRYSLTDEGLSRFAQDFYSYKLNKRGKQDSPVGSHVNPHTAGGFLEGGYLGFAGLQYAHMPLPGENLVAFLSDGAFEEQRGSDWTARWWRAEDSGIIAPVMILNGRRIDQRSTISQQEDGVKRFAEHLRTHDFDPIVFDGRDPAAFAWTIYEIEKKLLRYAGEIDSINNYSIRIPYGIAVAPKGAGFYNEGTNYAHNLPLIDNPSKNQVAAGRFNSSVKKVFVPVNELKDAVDKLQNHDEARRIKEKDHQIANRKVGIKTIPEWKLPAVSRNRISNTKWEMKSPMDAIDRGFILAVKENPHLRPRLGNPDEMLSNRMDDTLEELKFRVISPEEGIMESTLGGIISALNEEAVAAAAFGNKGGINIIVTYEAFGAKMFGEARQEIIFSKHQKNIGCSAGWLSVPIILTSNTWENSKNELSHQDTSMAESMISETSDISRVFFPADYNSAAALIKQVYQTQGEIWTVIIPKNKVPVIFTEREGEGLIKNGAARLKWSEYKSDNAKLALVAIGSFQLLEVLRASQRLREKKFPHIVTYIAEPGRFRYARNEGEENHLANDKILREIMPEYIENIVLATHTRPAVIYGTLLPLWKNRRVEMLGFINEGGTLDISSMLYVNKCSWAHILKKISSSANIAESKILSVKERWALNGKISPDGIITKI